MQPKKTPRKFKYSSTPKKDGEKLRSPDSASKWLEDYRNLFGWRLQPVTEAFLERIAEEYVTWIRDNHEIYRFTLFYVNKGIPYETFKGWIKKYPILQEAHNVVLQIIADRRETLAIKSNPVNALKMMPYYDQDWKTIEEWRAKNRADSDNKPEKTVIVMDRYEYENEKIKEDVRD